MKLTLMLWTAAAAVTIQLLAAASLEMEEKELEDAVATREVEVERREWGWDDHQQMLLLNAMGDAFQALLRLATRLSWKGRGGRRGRGRKFKAYSRYDDMPGKRNLKENEEEQLYNDVPGKNRERKRWPPYDCMPYKWSWTGRGGGGRKIEDCDWWHKRILEGQGGDAKESVAEQDAMALCRDFLNSLKIGEAADKAKRENKEQVEGKQEESHEEGKQGSQEEVELKNLVQIEKMLKLCMELIP